MNVPKASRHLMKKIEDYVESKAIAREPLKELSLMEKLQLQPKEATKR